jgi:hypothetical protein
MDFAKAYGLVASFLEARNARVAVEGGLGLHGYGLARATVDLDLVADAEAQESARGLPGIARLRDFPPLHRLFKPWAFLRFVAQLPEPTEPQWPAWEGALSAVLRATGKAN